MKLAFVALLGLVGAIGTHAQSGSGSGSGDKSSTPGTVASSTPGQLSSSPSPLEETRRCTANGDPHYETFDHFYYNWMGDCDYVLVCDNRGSPSFEIQVRNRRFSPSAGLGFPTVTDSVAIDFGNVTMILNAGFATNDRIDLGSGFVAYDYVTPPPAPATNMFTASVSGTQRTIEVPGLDLTIIWNGYSYIQVVMGPASPLMGSTCGLCGDSNGDGTSFTESPLVENAPASDFWHVPFAGGQNLFEAANVYEDVATGGCFGGCGTFSGGGGGRGGPDGGGLARPQRVTGIEEGECGGDNTDGGEQPSRFRRQLPGDGSCECDPSDEALKADAEEFCADLAFGGIFFSNCALWDEFVYDNCLCDYCYDRRSAVDTITAFYDGCAISDPGAPLPDLPCDGLPRHEMSYDRIESLCPDYAVDVGVKGKPQYGPDATMCNGQEDKADRLLLSMANGLFGKTSGPDRDCAAWCLFDVENTKYHFRWNNKKSCWKFKKQARCADANMAERQYAKDRQQDLCPVDES